MGLETTHGAGLRTDARNIRYHYVSSGVKTCHARVAASGGARGLDFWAWTPHGGVSASRACERPCRMTTALLQWLATSN
jgi:hypothetical protein